MLCAKRFISSGITTLAQIGDDSELLGVDLHNSPIFKAHSKKMGSTRLAFGPYGACNVSKETGILFNGKRVDTVSSDYPLGNGYRNFSPCLMRFRCPDSWSPFGLGGTNAYLYCGSDPINKTDPSGHASRSAIAGFTLGTIGLILGAATLGLATLSICAVAATLLAMTADAVGIASAILEESSLKLSNDLGWASLTLGLLSLSFSVGSRIKSFLTPKPKERFITLGGEKPIRISDNIIYYRDRYSKSDLNAIRGNFVFHTSHPDATNVVRNKVQAQSLWNLAKKVDVDGVGSLHVLRVVSCNSAETLIEHLAKISGLGTKGFKGPVEVSATQLERLKKGLPLTSNLVIKDESYNPVWVIPY